MKFDYYIKILLIMTISHSLQCHSLFGITRRVRSRTANEVIFPRLNAILGTNFIVRVKKVYIPIYIVAGAWQALM